MSAAWAEAKLSDTSALVGCPRNEDVVPQTKGANRAMDAVNSTAREKAPTGERLLMLMLTFDVSLLRTT